MSKLNCKRPPNLIFRGERFWEKLAKKWCRWSDSGLHPCIGDSSSAFKSTSALDSVGLIVFSISPMRNGFWLASILGIPALGSVMWRGGLPSTAVETVSEVPLLDENEHRAPGDLGDIADRSSKEPAENILKEPSVDPGNSPLLGGTEQTLAEVHLEQLRESLASDRSGKTSVEALVASALEELSGDERREYLRAMSRVVAEVDIALLDPILFQMGSIRDRNVVIRELVDYGVYRWAKEDPEAARSWVESATDPASRAGATGALVRAWADSAPREATQWVMENRDTFESELPLLQSSRAWAEAEPAAAAAWLQGLDDAGLQKRIFDSITRVRANQGSDEFKGWMEQVEDPGLVERANRIAQQAGRSGGGDR